MSKRKEFEVIRNGEPLSVFADVDGKELSNIEIFGYVGSLDEWIDCTHKINENLEQEIVDYIYEHDFSQGWRGEPENFE